MDSHFGVHHPQQLEKYFLLKLKLVTINFNGDGNIWFFRKLKETKKRNEDFRKNTKKEQGKSGDSS